MNEFRLLGFVDYNGSGLEVHSSLLNVSSGEVAARRRPPVMMRFVALLIFGSALAACSGSSRIEDIVPSRAGGLSRDTSIRSTTFAESLPALLAGNALEASLRFSIGLRGVAGNGWSGMQSDDAPPALRRCLSRRS
jgi:hypothetical protein